MKVKKERRRKEKGIEGKAGSQVGKGRRGGGSRYRDAEVVDFQQIQIEFLMLQSGIMGVFASVRRYMGGASKIYIPEALYMGW